VSSTVSYNSNNNKTTKHPHFQHSTDLPPIGIVSVNNFQYFSHSERQSSLTAWNQAVSFGVVREMCLQEYLQTVTNNSEVPYRRDKPFTQSVQATFKNSVFLSAAKSSRPTSGYLCVPRISQQTDLAGEHSLWPVLSFGTIQGVPIKTVPLFLFCDNFRKCAPILTIFSLVEQDIYDA